MAGRCAACNKHVSDFFLYIAQGPPGCPVCGQWFGRTPNEARKGLRRAAQHWLRAAPVHDVSWIEDEEEEDSEDQSRTSVSVLSVDDAVVAIADAVNKQLSQNICPDSLAVLPKMLRGDREFEYLSFANVTPTLPPNYSNILVRRREVFRSQWNDPEISSYVGTVCRVANRNTEPRSFTDIAVIWRLVRD